MKTTAVKIKVKKAKKITPTPKLRERVPEVPLDNLSGGQIQEVLDMLILSSLSPIVHNSKVFDTQIAYILGLVTQNKKRKLSALPREEFICILCQYLATSDTYEKVTLLEMAKIERGFLYNFVVNILKKLDGFMLVYQQSLISINPEESIRLDKRLAVMAREVGIPKDKVFVVYTQCTDYLELAYMFRNSIVNNYVRYAHKHAKIFCASKSNTFDFQDVWHNFLTAITKAIDKYDCSKGALTSYVKWWILNAQTSTNSDHGHEYGIAYSIPQLQRKGLALKDSRHSANYGISLDAVMQGGNAEELLKDYVTKDSGIEDHIEKEEESDITAYLIKKADLKGGLARLYLDVAEYFSEKEMRKMIQVMKRQGTFTENTHLLRRR